MRYHHVLPSATRKPVTLQAIWTVGGSLGPGSRPRSCSSSKCLPLPRSSRRRSLGTAAAARSRSRARQGRRMASRRADRRFYRCCRRRRLTRSRRCSRARRHAVPPGVAVGDPEARDLAGDLHRRERWNRGSLHPPGVDVVRPCVGGAARGLRAGSGLGGRLRLARRGRLCGRLRPGRLPPPPRSARPWKRRSLLTATCG